ncbi:efflux RND transporter periplasmic adaptor subunit [Leptolyngbya sp. FACHB-261]|uniref:efflux RND transporter periplasmic adaptor subunit n=1 Tax=Leptolyngbya sp. FACHB-261 TaxID=2692806 RepID=UPI0016826FF3|nr:efflux RND transporter periplasmic adaptor subunit [Leptolyngbya sp. FACHB-261]MBD2100086.1 efflux RND transporter periplasmic adaptor subunit [Leptolyngbya sp. FACHB-261]
MISPAHFRFTPRVQRLSGTLLSLSLLINPGAALAHVGHGNEFQGGAKANQASRDIRVDAETARRLGLKVEPVRRQRLAVGMKTTGQIEALPNQTVEVTTPIKGTVVRLLVAPGDTVKAGQAVAVLSSPELEELRVEAIQKRVEAEADLQRAQADLKLAQENYDRDRELQAEGAISRRHLLEAETELRRTQAEIKVAQSRIRLSSSAYEARLKQLKARANSEGLVTITAPITGVVSDREFSLGESAEEAGEPLMTILNGSRVWATASIYEKDLGQVVRGQQVRLTVASAPGKTFSGRIAQIGAAVEGETRVVPVRAELENANGLLKPGTFAELEILTQQTSKAVLTIPTSAVVEAGGHPTVYVQNGNAYQAVDVALGQTSGERVEVTEGLFEGDQVVTQRAPQLYAQSLRTGRPVSEAEGEAKEAASAKSDKQTSSTQIPWWVALPIGGAIAAGGFWAGRRTKPQMVLLRDPEYAGSYHTQGHPHQPAGWGEEPNEPQRPHDS